MTVSIPKLKDKEIFTFSKRISPKMNVIKQLELKLVYFEASVYYFSNYAMGTPRTYSEHNSMIPKSISIE